MPKEIFDFYDRTSLKSYNLDKTMQYQLNILGSLDVFTRKHSENVASLVCRICEYLHCTKSFTEYCTICAYLHDIGKQFIPPAILQKPSALTPEEFEIMKTHTTIGYKICMQDEKLRPYSAGPIYHHEALNGSGYPNGLTKDEIPYEGQIIKVADEYDAIASKRQYKSHVGIAETVKILISDATPPKASETIKFLADETKPEHNPSGSVKIPTLGKNNPIIVKALMKVVIDDIEYEISCTMDYLKDLKVKNNKLSPEFDSLNTEYLVFVTSDIEKLDLSYITNDELTKVKIVGNNKFVTGNNLVEIIVTNNDDDSKAERKYHINVIKEKAEDPTIMDNNKKIIERQKIIIIIVSSMLIVSNIIWIIKVVKMKRR